MGNPALAPTSKDATGSPRDQQQRLIGLVGGLSWQSTAHYYRTINSMMEQALGDHNNAESVVVTVNFAKVLAAGMAGDWDRVGSILADAGRTLAAAGCGCVLLTANTAHRVADQVQKAIDCPLIHIAEATGNAVKASGVVRPALLGTVATLESDLFQRPLDSFDLLLPEPSDRERLNRIILEELTIGKVTRSSRMFCTDLGSRMIEAGADSLIIGCTELPMIFNEFKSPVPCFDTVQIHVAAAVEFAIGSLADSQSKQSEGEI